MKIEVAGLSSLSLNSPYGLCGRKATLNLTYVALREVTWSMVV